MSDAPHGQEPSKYVFDKAHVEKKLRLAAELFRFAYETKRFQLRRKHPDLDEREINHRAYALIERGCTR
jgi:hypothetical protein